MDWMARERGVLAEPTDLTDLDRTSDRAARDRQIAEEGQETMTLTTLILSGKRYDALVRATKTRNRKFRALDLRAQRIAIARDVIARLDANTINAATNYFDVPVFARQKIFSRSTYDVDLSHVTQQVNCTVCGIGALFVGAVDCNDQLKLGEFRKHMDIDTRDAQVEYLAQWFDEEQLDRVEAWFEAWVVGRSSKSDAVVIQFMKRHPILDQSGITGRYMKGDQSKRLRMIMENIISNRGKFDPTKGRHAGRGMKP